MGRIIAASPRRRPIGPIRGTTASHDITLMASRPATSTLQYEAHERPRLPVTVGLSVQTALLVIAPTAVFPIVLVQAVGGSDAEVAWGVFAMLVINGAVTVLQAYRIGPFGAGMLVNAYPSPTAIPFCILALQEGGAPTLASLILVSGVFQVLLSLRLSLLRKLVTPAFSGTVLILLVITVIPVVFGSANDVPNDAPAAAGPVCILVTFVVIVGLLLKGSAAWRVWASLIGIVAGAIVGIGFGIFDFGPVREAAVAGLPLDGWPGFGFSFGSAFWSLLPAFLFLSAITVLQGNSIAMATQRVSWRESRAIDYRRVQGTTACSGLGTLVSCFAAALPITTGPRGVAIVQQTGCASRYIGIGAGLILILAAFFPQTWSLLIGVPPSATAMFMVAMLSPLVVEGMKLIVQDAPDFRKSLVIGSALVVGIGFQTGLVNLPIGDMWEAVFEKAFISGGVILVLLTIFVEYGRGGVQRRLRTEVSMDALPKIKDFLKEYSDLMGWDESMARRLHAVAEETLMILHEGGGEGRRLRITARSQGPRAELEFVSASASAENVEDRIALLTTAAPGEAELEPVDLESSVGRDAPLQLLRHYATSVSHRQYHDIEVIEVRVAPPAG